MLGAKEDNSRFKMDSQTPTHTHIYLNFAAKCVMCVFVYVHPPVVNPPTRHISLMKSNKSAPNDLLPEVASEQCEIR